MFLFIFICILMCVFAITIGFTLNSHSDDAWVVFVIAFILMIACIVDLTSLRICG